MSFSFNGLKAAVTISGGLTIAGQLAANARGGHAEISGAATTDVFQSALGETVNLKSLMLFFNQPNAVDAGVTIIWTDSANTVKQTLFDTTNGSNSGTAVNLYNVQIPVTHIQMASQDKIRMITANAGIWACIAVAGMLN